MTVLNSGLVTRPRVSQHALLSRELARMMYSSVLVSVPASRRIWPLKRFIEFGHFLKDKFGARILIFGGLEDRDEALRLQWNSEMPQLTLLARQRSVRRPLLATYKTNGCE